eukprot:3932990-Rhodomonas_salina.1
MDKYYALESGKMIMMEFHRQHLREVAEDLPITPFMANLHTPFEQARYQLLPSWVPCVEIYGYVIVLATQMPTRIPRLRRRPVVASHGGGFPGIAPMLQEREALVSSTSVVAPLCVLRSISVLK